VLHSLLGDEGEDGVRAAEGDQGGTGEEQNSQLTLVKHDHCTSPAWQTSWQWWGSSGALAKIVRRNEVDHK
jgi:hypothetical protein